MVELPPPLLPVHGPPEAAITLERGGPSRYGTIVKPLERSLGGAGIAPVRFGPGRCPGEIFRCGRWLLAAALPLRRLAPRQAPVGEPTDSNHCCLDDILGVDVN